MLCTVDKEFQEDKYIGIKRFSKERKTEEEKHKKSFYEERDRIQKVILRKRQRGKDKKSF